MKKAISKTSVTIIRKTKRKTPVFNYRRKVTSAGPSGAEIDAGYKRQRDSYAKPGDSSPARIPTLTPDKKKRRM